MKNPPLPHLHRHPKSVEHLKLVLLETGLGQEWVRAPGLTLAGAERKAVRKIIHDGIANCSKLPKRK